MADEVLPFVERRWRTAPMRVLIGHSLGGLFALHTLAKRPDLFTPRRRTRASARLRS